MLSRMVFPCKGHIEQVFHIFAYLIKHINAEMVFDTIDPVAVEEK